MAFIPLPEDPRWLPFVERYAGSCFRFAIEVLGITPSHQQRELLEAITVPGARVSVASGHGCFAPDTEILMHDGSVKKVQDIEFFDKLMGPDGEPRNVLKTYSGEDEMFRVVYKDGTEHIVNEPHELVLYYTRSKAGGYKYGEEIRMTPSQFLALPEWKKRILAVNRVSIELPEKELPIDPWLLGFWLAEGTAHSGEFTVAAKDSETLLPILEEKASQIGCTMRATYYPSKSSYVVRFRGVWVKLLRKLDLIDNKHVPEDYMRCSVKQRQEFLSGMFDGDGYLDTRKRVVMEITQKSKQIADSIVFIARSLGIRCRVQETQKECTNTGAWGTYHRVCLSRNTHKIPCKLERKRAYPSEKTSLFVGIESVERIGNGQYYGVSVDKDHTVLDAQMRVISNTGKSMSLSIIIPWLLFTHYKAWVLVTANDIDQIKASTLKEIASQIGRLKEGPYAWLADKIELMASGDLRVRGYEQNWLMELKTANAKNANKMAGRHAKFLTIIADEGSSIPDTVMMTLNGALTEAANRFIITSQPTKNSGFFYDTFNRLSERNGGHWHNITMSSIDSPHVSDESLKTLWAMYDDDERRVRILGLFPQDSARFFVGRKAVENAYKRGRIINANEHYGYFICCDIASGEGLRDKSAVSVCRVYGYGEERRVEVVDIPLFTNNIRSNQFAHYIIEAAAPYPNVTFVVDSGGLGINVCQDLEDAGKMVQRVNWGNPCFRNVNKDRYLNLRAQATHQLARAIKEGRFSVLTNDHRAVGLDQVSRIPKTFTDKGRLRVPPKHGPEWEGMGSPDLADTWAFAFLETSTYTASGESVSDKTMISAAEAATEEAANLFSDL